LELHPDKTRLIAPYKAKGCPYRDHAS